MTTKDLPVSGYTILAVYTTSQQLRHLRPEQSPDQEQVKISWDWRWTEAKVLEVRIEFVIDVPGRAARISADCIGRFRQVEDSPSVSIDEFVSLQAVAMLLPYARQFLSTLTMSTLPGPYYLPSLNVTEIRKDFNLDGATGKNQDFTKLAVGHVQPRAVRKTKATAFKKKK